jgi:hypothetical protein
MGLFQQPSYPQQVTQQQTQAPQLSPAQQNLQNVSANFLASQVGQPAPAYSGQLVAPLTPAQQQQVSQGVQLGQESYVPQQQGLGALGAFSSGAYLPTQLGQAGAGTLANMATGGTPSPPNPWLAAQLGATANLAQQQFAQSIPALRAPFVAAGQTGFSSPELAGLYQASAQAQTGLQSQLANELMAAQQTQQANQLAAAQSALGAYQQAQGMQLQAAPQAVQAGGAVQTMANQLAALPQQTQQAQYQAAYNDWLRQLAGAWAATGVPATGALTAAYPISTTGQAQYPPLYGPSPFQSVLGGLSSLAGPAMTYMMGSKMGWF